MKPLKPRKARNQNPANNPTEIIFRLLKEYATFIGEYTAVLQKAAANPNAPIYTLELQYIEHPEFIREQARREIYAIKQSQAARDSMQRVRMRQAEGVSIRRSSTTHQIRPEEPQPEIPAMTQPGLSAEDLARINEQLGLTPKTLKDYSPSKPGRATHTSDGKEIKYPEDDWDPNADLINTPKIEED